MFRLPEQCPNALFVLALRMYPKRIDFDAKTGKLMIHVCRLLLSCCMEDQIRVAARRYLHPGLRKLLGCCRRVAVELREWAIGDGVKHRQQILRECDLEFVGCVGWTESRLRK